MQALCWTSVFRFLLLGPLFGLLGFLVSFPLIDPTVNRLTDFTDIRYLMGLMSRLLIGIPFAYLIGAIPALLAGMLYSRFMSLINLPRNALTHAAMGTASGAICGLVLALFIGFRLPIHVMYMGGLCAFSGACCAFFASRSPPR